jgi:hypothetical protein
MLCGTALLSRPDGSGEPSHLRNLVVGLILPGVSRPTAFGFKTDMIQRTIAVDDEGTL